MNKELNMKTNTNPAQYSHSYSLSFYTSFSSFFPDPLLALFVFVSLFFFFLFKSMTLSFSLKYQHLSVQHMAADAAHARHHGAAPCLDTLQVLRHLAERQGLLRHAPHRDGGFLHRRRIRLRQGRRH